MGNLQTVIDNTTRSKSVMIDADFSQETTKFTRVNVLQQGATSMLAQANAQKNLVLTLFQS
jgi:flagellin